jgi:hypothetical protein
MLCVCCLHGAEGEVMLCQSSREIEQEEIIVKEGGLAGNIV